MGKKKHHRKSDQEIQNPVISKKLFWYDQLNITLIFILITSLVFTHSIKFYSIFTSTKLFSLRIITLIILLLTGYKFFKEKQINLSTPKFYLGLLGYGFVCVLNTIISINTYTSLFGQPDQYLGLFTVLNFILIAFLTAQILNTKNLQTIFIKYFISIGFISAIYGFLQYHQFIGDPSMWDQDPTLRVFGTFGHSNHFAAFLGMNIMLSLGIFFYTKNFYWKVFAAAGVLISFITLSYTASRGGLFAVLFSLLFFGLIFFHLIYKNFKTKYEIKNLKSSLKFIWQKYHRTSMSLLTSLIIFVIIIVSSSPLIINKFQNSYIFQRFEALNQTFNQGLIPDRVSWWLSMFAMIKDSPIYGHGLSTFKDRYNAYRRLDYRNIDDLQYEVTPESGHMEYLSIFATQGVIGLTTYLIPIIFVFYLALKKFKEENLTKEHFLLLGLLSALMVYLTQVLISFGVVDIWSMFFILLGFTAIFINTELKKEIKFGNATTWAIFLIIILIFVFGTKFSITQIKVEFWRRQTVSAETAKVYNHAIESYEKILELENKNAFYHADYGDFLFRLANLNEYQSQKEELLKQAISHYDQAIALNPWQPHFFANLGLSAIHLAKFYTELKSNQELTGQYLQITIKAYEQAIKNGPNNPLHLYNLMKVYALVSQFDKFYQTGDEILTMRKDYKDTLDLLIEVAKFNKDLEKAEYYETMK